jgi:hypothetical protein
MHMGNKATVVRVNRAPVLTLWAAVVAERLGYGRGAALTLGKAVAGMNAQAKGRRLGIYHERDPEGEPERPRRAQRRVELLGRRVAVVRTRAGLRALDGDQPGDPETVERYLAGKLGEALAPTRAAMSALARSLSRAELGRRGYALYEAFRPKAPPGERGWGRRGALDLTRIRELAEP